MIDRIVTKLALRKVKRMEADYIHSQDWRAGDLQELRDEEKDED